jgi:hypothetical protein
MFSSRANPLTNAFEGGALALHWRMRSTQIELQLFGEIGEAAVLLVAGGPDKRC